MRTILSYPIWPFVIAAGTYGTYIVFGTFSVALGPGPTCVRRLSNDRRPGGDAAVALCVGMSRTSVQISK